MDNIFGIGLPELVLILVIAGMVMGPERIARSARTLGSLTARLQTISRTFLRQLNAELDAVDETGQLKSTIEELDQLRQQVTELRNEVVTLTAGTSVSRDFKRELENSIMPPRNRLSPKAAPAGVAGEPDRVVIPEPPSLAMDDEPLPAGDAVPTRPVTTQPVNLPKRIDVAEDPDV